MPLPNDRDARNALPVWDGCIAYFPDAWAEIAKVSVLGNKQHALGAELHFARDVSTDHLNKVFRHCLDHEGGRIRDLDGARHLAKAAWRILAALQVSIEAETGVIARTAVNSADLPKETAHGSPDDETEKGTSAERLRAALDAKGWTRWVPDTRPLTREERAIPGLAERDLGTESGRSGKGSQ